MKPEDKSNSQSGLPLLRQRSFLGTPAEKQPIQQTTNATVGIIKSQINNIFESQENKTDNVAPQPSESSNPYDRTHIQHVDPQADQWKQYHTAWQNYYQKYYEGYYAHRYKTAIESASKDGAKSEQEKTDRVVFDLRQKLRNKVHHSAQKIRHSRHFVPILSGFIVILIFLFLQYNQFIIGNIVAYVSPGEIDPQNIIVDPNSTVAVSSESRLIIPKINVDVPVIYDIGSDYDSQMAAMTRGVAHFSIPGANSHPGEIGNTVIAGHSSNDLFDVGDYKFIFAQLDKLEAGDTVYANYKSVRYTYVVTKKEVVSPTETDKLVYTTDTPMLTLITCTPLGTSRNRLLVTAKQISPDPTTAVKSTETATTDSSSMPGSSKTIWEMVYDFFKG